MQLIVGERSGYVKYNIAFVLPDGAAMLTMALNFEASKSGSFRSIQRLSNGDVSMQWIDETRPASPESGTITVPSEFTIAIPVFENGEKYTMTSRLKYRAKDGTLTIWYELVRPHKTVEQAFRNIWAAIEKDTDRIVLLGTPE